MDKDKCGHNCDSSGDESAGNWKHPKRTRVEKCHQSVTSVNKPTVGSPFPSTSGRYVPSPSRTQRPSTVLNKSTKKAWISWLKESTARAKGSQSSTGRPCDKRSQTENWMKMQASLSEQRQPLENPVNRCPNTSTPVPSLSPSYAELRARKTNIYIEKLIAARSGGRYKHLSNIDLMQCKKLDKILDNNLWSAWAWSCERQSRENEARKTRTGSPVASRSSARAEIDALSPSALPDRQSTSRPTNCSSGACLKMSQPGSSTSLPATSERLSRMSDTPLTTDQVELLVQCDRPVPSGGATVLMREPHEISEGPDDNPCNVSFAEDSPATRASKKFVDGGFITHLVGSLNHIAPEPLECSPELPNVPSPPMENEIILDVPMDEIPDSGDSQPHNVTTELLQPGEEAVSEKNIREQEQVQIKPSASQESLTNAPAEQHAGTSRENVNEGLNKAILSLLECPVCMEVMAPPLAQCRRGHLLCQGCRKIIASCPTCRSRFTASRNLAMEKVAEKLLYPCRHAGCTAVLPFMLRGQHEASCGRRTYLCSMPRCKKRALLQYDELLQHHQTHHSDILLWGSVTNFEIDIVNESMQDDWLVRAHNELFHIHFCVDTYNWGINSSVTYIGPKKNAQNFIYKMSVEDNSYVNRKFSYQRTTHSDVENRTMNYSRRDAFFIPLDGALFFARKKKLEHNKFSNFLCVTLNIKCRNCGDVDEESANDNVE